MKTPDMDHTSQEERKMKSNVRAQHEAVNGQLKQFNVLTTHFRHLKPRNEVKNKHKACFFAVVEITQSEFTLDGEKVFSNELECNCNHF